MPDRARPMRPETYARLVRKGAAVGLKRARGGSKSNPRHGFFSGIKFQGLTPERFVYTEVDPAYPGNEDPPTCEVRIGGTPVGSVSVVRSETNRNATFKAWKWSWTPPATPAPYFQPGVEYAVQLFMTPFGQATAVAGPTMTVSDKRVITYNSENYPDTITCRGRTVRFVYDADNVRIKKVNSNQAAVLVDNRYQADGTTALSLVGAVSNTVYAGRFYEVRDGKTYKHVFGIDDKRLCTIEKVGSRHRGQALTFAFLVSDSTSPARKGGQNG